ncbi:uncharacterized protein METZ01_LOCUS469324, partial [marine metagenome]
RLGIVTIQGIFPKRQKAFAEKLGAVVANELFSIKEVTSKLIEKSDSQEVLNEIRNGIRAAIDEFMEKNLALANFLVSDKMKWDIAHQMTEVFRPQLRRLAKRMSREIENDMDVETIVREKVANFSSDKLEEILFAIMKREFRFVEMVGAVLGFLIGSGQLAITWTY